MDGQVTAITKHDRIRIFTITFIADSTSGIFAYSMLFPLIFGDPLLEFVPLLLDFGHRHLEDFTRYLVAFQMIFLASFIVFLKPRIILS
jgi:hypothetical protein